jgi:hypothetical protein
MLIEQTQALKLIGVPGRVYLEMLCNIGRWMDAAMRRKESCHEICVRTPCITYGTAAERQHSGIAGLVQFARSVVRKWLNAHRVRSQPSG